MSAGGKLTLPDITSGKFAAKTVNGINPIEGTDTYARISQDGERVVCCSFKTGKELSVLFDVKNTMGCKIDGFDDYVLSPDGKRMLIQTKTERIYRRSFKADFYIYNIESRRLDRLSDGDKQQIPTWSPDGQQVAFVRGGNIFLVKLLYDNAEIQVTKDGKFNEVINGLPDWVNEEEFGFNSALTFNADGTMICWIRYDESKVKTYSLEMYKGMKPAKEEYAAYPGSYSYKYPKAGEDNSTVSAWSYDIKSHKINRLQVPLDADGYMPRIKPTNDPMRIVVYTMNRHQDDLCLYAVNPRSTVAQLIIKEHVDKYVREEAMEGVKFVGDKILLPSDRSGYTKLYIYNMNGQLQRTMVTATTTSLPYMATTPRLATYIIRLLPLEPQIVRSTSHTRTARQYALQTVRDGTRRSSQATSSTSSIHGATITLPMYSPHAHVRAS